MKPNRVDPLLEEWAKVAHSARRPDAPPRAAVIRSGLPFGTLAGAATIVAALAIGGLILNRPAPDGAAATSPSAVGGSHGSQPSTAATPTSSIGSTPGPCDPTTMDARLTLWDGAAGSRIAHLRLTNSGPVECFVDALERPQLVGGDGAVLIDGAEPGGSGTLIVPPGGTLTTEISASNYCGPAPSAPVTVAVVFADGRRLVADPVSPDDTTVPPCLGSSQPAAITMHAWAS